MNKAQPDAVARIVGRGSGWAMTGIDPEGADFRRGGEIARVTFANPVWGAGAALSELGHLARVEGATPAGGA
jgi:hypothetical protein